MRERVQEQASLSTTKLYAVKFATHLAAYFAVECLGGEGKADQEDKSPQKNERVGQQEDGAHLSQKERDVVSRH